MEKVKHARADRLEGNENHDNFGTLSTTNGGFSEQIFDNRRFVQPCLYLLFHDPTEKRRVLFLILIFILFSLIQMFSEFFNHQFLAIIH